MKNILIYLGLLFLFVPAAVYAYDYRDQYNQYSASSVNNPYNQYQYSSGTTSNPYNSQYKPYAPDSVNNPYSKYELQNSSQNLDDPFAKKAKEFNAEMAAKAAKKRQVQEGKERAEEVMAAKFLKPKATYPVLFYLLLFSFAVIASGLTIYLVVGIFKK